MPGKNNELYNRFLTAFKKGMRAEAQDDYSAVNDSIPDKKKQALGRYQFVPQYHLDEIQKFAKANGYGDLGPSDYQAFLNNKDLQDSYFESYVQKEVFPFVLKNKDKLNNMSLDEAAALYHFQGPSVAQKIITTGQSVEKTKYNPSSNEYLRRHREARKSKGGEPIYDFSPEYVSKKYKEFKTRLDAIEKNSKGYSEDLVAQKKIELQIEYQKQGLLEPFNQEIKQENVLIDKQWRDKDKQKYNQAKAAMDLLESRTYASTDINKDWYYNEKGGINHKDPKNYTFLLPATDETVGKSLEQMGEYAKYFKLKNNGKERYFEITIPKQKDPKSDNLFNAIEKNIQPLPNNKDFKLYGNDGKPLHFNYLGKNKDAPVGYKFNWTIDSPAEAAVRSNMNGIHRPPSDATYKHRYKKRLEPVAIPPEPIVEEKVEVPTVVDPNKPTQTEMQQIIDYNNKIAADKQKATEREIANDFFQERTDPIVDQPGEYKNDFPYVDVFSQLAGVVAGMSMGDDRLNRRDEQVNDDFRNYAAELAQIASRGLSPEEEAYRKQMLTEAYQGSYNRIVEASNGNRNSVLGNAGRVDAQRNYDMMNLALADEKAKNEALYKYGEAMKYIGEIDINREIANNERKYNEILKTKQAGSEIAGAAMGAFVDSIQTYQDNKPGSWNHMYKSHMSKRMFGIDFTLKDDGSGTVPYTASWKREQEKKIIAKNQEFNSYRQEYNNLSPDQKLQVNKHLYENENDPFSVYKLIDKFKTENGQKPIEQTGKEVLQQTGATETATQVEQKSKYADVFTSSATGAPQTNTETKTETNVPESGYTGLKAVMTEADKINAETEQMKNSNQTILTQAKAVKDQISEVIQKSEKGLIDAQKGNTLIDKMIGEAKTFIE